VDRKCDFWWSNQPLSEEELEGAGFVGEKNKKQENKRELSATASNSPD
jgi:hypothetical protein